MPAELRRCPDKPSGGEIGVDDFGEGRGKNWLRFVSGALRSAHSERATVEARITHAPSIMAPRYEL